MLTVFPSLTPSPKWSRRTGWSWGDMEWTTSYLFASASERQQPKAFPSSVPAPMPQAKPNMGHIREDRGGGEKTAQSVAFWLSQWPFYWGRGWGRGQSFPSCPNQEEFRNWFYRTSMKRLYPTTSRAECRVGLQAITYVFPGKRARSNGLSTEQMSCFTGPPHVLAVENGAPDSLSQMLPGSS